jgi:hypothetical protein
MTITLNGGIGSIYSFDSFEGAIKRINAWFEQGLINEDECMGFIIQMFHQIPESNYNNIINKISE